MERTSASSDWNDESGESGEILTLPVGYKDLLDTTLVKQLLNGERKKKSTDWKETK